MSETVTKHLVVNNFITVQMKIEIPVHHLWKNDFAWRWKNHESKTNSKIIEILQFFGKNEIIVDAGSHVGDTGLFMTRFLQFRNIPGKIVEIDPDKTKLEFIQSIIRMNHIHDYVHTIHAGISNQTGKGTLHKKEHPGAWTVKRGNDFDITTLDKILLPMHKKVFLIKLDVEGMELQAVEGGLQTILRYKPLLLVEMYHKQKKNMALHEKLTVDLLYQLIWEGGLDALYIHPLNNPFSFH